jgi:hypothetical protein
MIPWDCVCFVPPSQRLCCCCWCVQVLQQLASLQPAVDEEGSVLQPLPRAHRGIADPACLPHIAQVMLTGTVDPGLPADS